MERFRAEVADRHATDRIHLLFNNAGIGGGSSLIVNSCEEWERPSTSAGGSRSFARCGRGPYQLARVHHDRLRCRRSRNPLSSWMAASTSVGRSFDAIGCFFGRVFRSQYLPRRRLADLVPWHQR
jgi:hypothetical protein